ncbi:MAG TPA: DNA alkylation repair protein [Rhodothermales bacterium]
MTSKQTREARSVEEVLARLEALGTDETREGMARYGIVAPRAFGVTVGDVKKLGKELGTDHALALALWESEWYEARLLCAFIADPKVMSTEEMDAWCRDFDNWAVVDTATFHLFDRSPHAWSRVDAWCPQEPEFVRRAGFALLACLALHQKKTPDERFRERLPLIDAFAHDDRNFVKKAVNWALRAIGTRPGLRADAIDLARRLAESDDRTRRWVGKDALRAVDRRP